ncbi:MAG: hypothetical protein PHO41_07390 [Eubacteriales bacterium]|nr:hypothetical protein [Eubacteriales bacterium]
MKRRIGISPVLVEMVFMLLFFALSATVVVRLLGAAASISRESREQSEALSVTTAAMEELLADPAALEKGSTTIVNGSYTVNASISSEQQGNGTLYNVACETTKDEKSLFTLEGSRFVGLEEVS